MRRFTYLTIVIMFLLGLLIVAPAGAAPARADRGAWAVGVAYAVNDTVTYGGSTYKCLQAHTSQADWTPPATPALWQLVGTASTATNTSVGPTATRTNTPVGPTATRTNTPAGPTATRTNTPTGPTATRTNTPVVPTATRTNTPVATATSGGSGCWPAWVSTQVYTQGAQVSENGRNYQANYWTQGNDPATNSGPVGTGQPWIPMLFCGGSPSPTPGGSGLAAVLTSAQFDQMFPSRNAFYTYTDLLTAAAFYPAFGGTGGTTVEKQEVAAAMANFAHETGGLWYIEEISKSAYCDTTNTQYPCAAGKEYYGRGPIQISWNFNYGAAGAALGLPILANPDLVAQDASVAWKTALWYWMTQNGPGTMPAHSCMTTGAGFGCTIRSINGALECNGGNTAEMQDRVNYYNTFTGILGVPPGSNLTC